MSPETFHKLVLGIPVVQDQAFEDLTRNYWTFIPDVGFFMASAVRKPRHTNPRMFRHFIGYGWVLSGLYSENYVGCLSTRFSGDIEKAKTILTDAVLRYA